VDGPLCGRGSELPCASIATAASQSSPGDEVVVLPGTYREILLTCPHELVVRSRDGPATTVIDGQDRGTVLLFVDLSWSCEWSGFTVRGGVPGVTGKGGGAMILNTAAHVHLHDMILRENHAVVAASEGGGIYIKESSSLLERVEFYGNVAFRGGGVYLCTHASPVFRDCLFSGNSVVSGGKGGNLVMENSSTGNFYRCIFQSGDATFGGGVADGSQADTYFEECTFRENRALFGGAFYLTSDLSSQFVRCNFSSNAAVNSGGGGEVAAETRVRLEDFIFEHNTAKEAGALRVTRGLETVVQGCTFRNNSAASFGGALTLQGSSQLTTCLFENNWSDAYGGAIYLLAGKSPHLLDSLRFEGNRAALGAAIAVDGQSDAGASGQVSLMRSSFRRGDASISGGALFCLGRAVVNVAQSHFEKNVATDGGAVGISAQCALTLEQQCVFLNNHARQSGGAITFTGPESSLVIDGSTVENNTAITYGGGIMMDPVGALSVRSLVLRGNQARYGGGISTAGQYTTACDQIIQGSVRMENNTAAIAGGGWFTLRGTGCEPCMSVGALCSLEGNVAGEYGPDSATPSAQVIALHPKELLAQLQPSQHFSLSLQLVDAFNQSVHGFQDTLLSLVVVLPGSERQILDVGEPDRYGELKFSSLSISQLVPPLEMELRVEADALHPVSGFAWNVTLLPCRSDQLLYVTSGGEYHCLSDAGASTAVRWLVGVLGIIGAVLTVAVFIVLVVNRTTSVVRNAHLQLSVTMLLGVFLAFVYVTLYISESDVLCVARLWVGSLGVWLLYGCILIKTGLIVHIFHRTNKLAVARISPLQLVAATSALLFPLIVVLAVWMGVGPPLHHYDVDLIEGTYVDQCTSSESVYFFWILFGYLALVMAGCCVMTILGRNVPARFNETTHLAFAIYNFFVVLIVVVILAWTITNSITFYLASLSVLYTTAITLAVIFLPKLYFLAMRRRYIATLQNSIVRLENEILWKQQELKKVQRGDSSSQRGDTSTSASASSRTLDGDVTGLDKTAAQDMADVVTRIFDSSSFV
jgi:predicted outer membrane repeat protein